LVIGRDSESDQRDARAWRRKRAAERVRLEAEAGVGPSLTDHFRRRPERPFTESERAGTTILLGGLTRLHDTFIEATFHGAGYRCERLPVPDVAAFHLGREYCDNGLCSPAYFNIGNLIATLQRLEASGLDRKTIADRYLFFTAGAGGPCRFGMYESEYRLALDNAGFGDFRVLTFQQGISQSGRAGAGLSFTLSHALGILQAFHLADALNDLAHRSRPYEVVPGATDRALAACEADACAYFREYHPPQWHEGLPPWLVRFVSPRRLLRYAATIISDYRHVLGGQAYGDLLRRCAARFDDVELDRTRVRPVVKITGEFWAQTTEGDGNYRMFEFLEREGAEVAAEPLGTWVTYLAHSAKLRYLDRRSRGRWAAWRGVKDLWRDLETRMRAWSFDFGEYLYTRELDRTVRGVGAPGPHLVRQQVLADLARPYYDPRVRGGEGHLEVAKNIHYTTRRECHMVLSLKPFGCLPSSQSDGVQVAVVDRHPEMIFLPVETSGEGEVQAHSRVQMSLADARASARAEFDAALSATGLSLDRVLAFVAKFPTLRRGLYRVPPKPGVACRAAAFVYHVRDLMTGRPVHEIGQRARGTAAPGRRLPVTEPNV
jgi:predicted nucleotide-binding protein (sugar kinase/HSP70/actin superfamily)